MTREERMAFVSERLLYFIPVVAHATMEATGAVERTAEEIVDAWEAELRDSEKPK